MKKILTVVYDLEKGGTQRAAQVFAQAYHKLGHESRILVLYGLGSRYEEIKEEIFIWFKLGEANAKEISNWEPDIIHIHSHGPKPKDINKLLDLDLRNSVAIETNVFSRPSPWASRIDVSFQLSEWAQWLFDIRGGSRYNSSVLPYPVKNDNFSRVDDKSINEFKDEHQIPNDSFVIGRIGQSSIGKWSTMLIEIFEKISERGKSPHLLLINPPEEIINQANSSSFADKITIIPQLLGDLAISKALSSMDVMLHIASQGESFGMVLAEALLCEVPVVTLSTPWGDNSQGEVIGKGGMVAHSMNSAVSQVIKIMDEPSLKHQLGAFGRDHIVQSYDYIALAKKAIELCDSKSLLRKRINNRRLLSLLKNSVDHPNFFTVSLLLTGNNFLRYLSKYTSGYNKYII